MFEVPVQRTPGEGFSSDLRYIFERARCFGNHRGTDTLPGENAMSEIPNVYRVVVQNGLSETRKGGFDAVENHSMRQNAMKLREVPRSSDDFTFVNSGKQSTTECSTGRSQSLNVNTLDTQ